MKRLTTEIDLGEMHGPAPAALGGGVSRGSPAAW
jgi:hypothetical protein